MNHSPTSSTVKNLVIVPNTAAEQGAPLILQKAYSGLKLIVITGSMYSSASNPAYEQIFLSVHLRGYSRSYFLQYLFGVRQVLNKYRLRMVAGL